MPEATRECPSCALDGPKTADRCPYCGYEYPDAPSRLTVWTVLILLALLAIPLAMMVRHLL